MLVTGILNGGVILDGPATDGAADQIVATDGSKQLSFRPGLVSSSGHSAFGNVAELDNIYVGGPYAADILFSMQEEYASAPINNSYVIGQNLEQVLDPSATAANSYYILQNMQADTKVGNVQPWASLGGQQVSMNHRGSGAVSSMYCSSYSMLSRSAGVVGDMTAMYARVGCFQASGNVTVAKALQIGSAINQSGSSVIETLYGIYIGAQTVGTTNYQIFSAGTAPSQFAGPLVTSLFSGVDATGANTAAADTVFESGIPTGNAAAGKVVFKSTTVGSSGSTPQAQATALTIEGTTATFAGEIVATGRITTNNHFTGNNFEFGGYIGNVGVTVAIASNFFSAKSDYVIGWTASGVHVISGGTTDTGIGRNAAGVLEVNNGTLGTFRDMKVRTVRLEVFTDATLPAAGVAGRVAYSSDSGLVYDDGANWKKTTWSNV